MSAGRRVSVLSTFFGSDGMNQKTEYRKVHDDTGASSDLGIEYSWKMPADTLESQLAPLAFDVRTVMWDGSEGLRVELSLAFEGEGEPPVLELPGGTAAYAKLGLFVLDNPVDVTGIRVLRDDDTDVCNCHFYFGG